MVALWLKFQAWIIGAGAFILFAGALLLKAFLAGKASEKAKQAANDLKAFNERRAKDAEVKNRSDDKLSRDFNKWVRKDK